MLTRPGYCNSVMARIQWRSSDVRPLMHQKPISFVHNSSSGRTAQFPSHLVSNIIRQKPDIISFLAKGRRLVWRQLDGRRGRGAPLKFLLVRAQMSAPFRNERLEPSALRLDVHLPGDIHECWRKLTIFHVSLHQTYLPTRSLIVCRRNSRSGVCCL